MLNGMRILMEGNKARRSLFSTIVVMFCLVLCPLGPAIGDTDIDILLLNTEFFFDDVELHKDTNKKVLGDIEKLKELKLDKMGERTKLLQLKGLGKDGLKPIQKDLETLYKTFEACYKKIYELKAYSLAQFIDKHDPDIVGLVEIENRAVVEKLKSHLTDSKDWQIVFEEGRDRPTGQDVTILTKFPFVPESVTTFPNEQEDYVDEKGEERSTKPSKILGVELTIDDQPFYIIIAHLISQIRPSDAKRLAQAKVVRRQAVKAMIADKNVIVMGDMNDAPGEPPINHLRGFDDSYGKLVQTADVIPDGELQHTYEHDDDELLFDHILLSPSLDDEFQNVKEKRCEIIDVGALSDHDAIIVRLRIK